MTEGREDPFLLVCCNLALGVLAHIQMLAHFLVMRICGSSQGSLAVPLLGMGDAISS